MKYICIFGLTLISFTSYPQSWEVLMDDYSNVYNITNYENKLFVVGSKDGNYVFSSSNDNGETWNDVVLNDNISEDSGIPISVGFFNSQVGIIGIIGSYTKEYLKTEDGGSTWESFTPNIGDDCEYVPYPYEIVIVNNTTAIIQHMASGNFIITHDSGNSWECSYGFSTAYFPKITVLNSKTYFNCDKNGLYKSSDEGQTWIRVFNKSLSNYSMYNEQIGIAVSAWYSEDELYLTNDGWTTFETIPLSDSEFGHLGINSIVPITSEELFFFEGEKIYYSKDAGRSVSFFQELTFQPIHAKNVNGQWYITGRGLAKYNPDGLLIDYFDQMEDIALLSNPVTNSEIRLNTRNFFWYQIYDLNGKLIQEGFNNNGEVSFKSTVKGLYLLNIQNKNKTEQKSFKILIE